MLTFVSCVILQLFVNCQCFIEMYWGKSANQHLVNSLCDLPLPPPNTHPTPRTHVASVTFSCLLVCWLQSFLLETVGTCRIQWSHESQPGWLLHRMLASRLLSRFTLIREGCLILLWNPKMPFIEAPLWLAKAAIYKGLFKHSVRLVKYTCWVASNIDLIARTISVP